MTELTKSKSLEEGVAVKVSADLIAEKYGIKGEPTKEMYEEAFRFLETSRELSPETSRLFVRALNLWGNIKSEIGKDDASKLGKVYNEAVETCDLEVREFIRGEREIDDVAAVLDKVVADGNAGKDILSRHSGLSSKMTEYVRLGLEVAVSLADEIRSQ